MHHRAQRVAGETAICADASKLKRGAHTSAILSWRSFVKGNREQLPTNRRTFLLHVLGLGAALLDECEITFVLRGS